MFNGGELWWMKVEGEDNRGEDRWRKPSEGSGKKWRVVVESVLVVDVSGK